MVEDRTFPGRWDGEGGGWNAELIVDEIVKSHRTTRI
jgi:hypothetical protein